MLVFTGTAMLTAERRDKAGMPMFDPACRGTSPSSNALAMEGISQNTSYPLQALSGVLDWYYVCPAKEYASSSVFLQICTIKQTTGTCFSISRK